MAQGTANPCNPLRPFQERRDLQLGARVAAGSSGAERRRRRRTQQQQRGGQPRAHRLALPLPRAARQAQGLHARQAQDIQPQGQGRQEQDHK